MSEAGIEKELRDIFYIPDNVECEIIERSREGKISYHVRFNLNMDYNTIMFCLESSKS